MPAMSLPFLIYKVLSFLKSALSVQRNNAIETAQTESLLWEISGNGLRKPSYFFGTMHMMSAEDAVLSDNVKRLIKQVRQIYLEVNMADMEQLSGGDFNVAMRDEITLADLLTEADYEKVKSFFEHHQPHVPFATIERQKPLMISSSLYELFVPMEQMHGIDMRVLEEAGKFKRHIGGLESLAIQNGILDKIPYRDQALELIKTIGSINTYVTTLQEMVKVYKQQDIHRLHDLATKEE